MATAARQHSHSTFTFGTWLTKAFEDIRRARMERATFAALSNLSDRELDDLGLTRDSLAEAARRAVAQNG